jgi:hypothetical protein
MIKAQFLWHGRANLRKPITLDEVKAANALVWDAYRQTAHAFGALWNLTMGNFE